MSLFDLPRIPESEVMDDSGEVDAYSSAAAQAFLDKIDDTFVAHALRLLWGRESGRALDIGTGPGQIVLKLARRLPGWHFTAVDRSPNMIAQARRNAVSVAPGFNPITSAEAASTGAQQAAPVSNRADFQVRQPMLAKSEGASTPEGINRVQFLIADGNRLDFPGQSFDFVLCNSVLHHLAEPQNVLSEIARLVKPDGAILLRDLRRPSRLGYRLHVRWYGRHYSGLMYRLYCASVRAAYTVPELEALLRRSPLVTPSANGIATRVFTHARTHLGIERPLA